MNFGSKPETGAARISGTEEAGVEDMFTVTQETENGQKLWPGINHVYTSGDQPGRGTVTALFAAGGLMDFHPSKKRQMIYVMNEAGSTVGRYDLGNDPNAPEYAEGPREVSSQEFSVAVEGVLDGGRHLTEVAVVGIEESGEIYVASSMGTPQTLALIGRAPSRIEEIAAT